MKKIHILVLFILLMTLFSCSHQENNKNVDNGSIPKITPENELSQKWSDTCDIWIDEITLWNGQVWSCKNLWATTVRDGTSQPDDCSWIKSNCNSSLTWIWDYYQWGRNDTGWTNGTEWNNFWWEPQNDTKWGWSTSDTPTSNGAGTTNVGRQWPCQSGRHVPSAKDWQDACNTILGTTCSNGMEYNSLIFTKLKLPFAGFRNRDNGYYGYQSTDAHYWSSSPNSFNSYYLYYDAIYINPAEDGIRARGLTVRCVKN